MKYGKIAGIDKPVSRIVQGTVMLSADDIEKTFELLDAAYEAGINTFDCAHVYGGGQCDRALGQWVRDRGLRDKIVLMDKCCHPNPDRRRVRPFDLTSDLHDCLARLKFDHIDILALHRDDESLPVGPIIERLNEHLREGKIGALGASNWTHQRIGEANEYASAHGMTGFAVSSPHFSLAERHADPWGVATLAITGTDGAEARQWYQGNQMVVMPWSALAGGFFSGRFTRDNLDSFTAEADLRCVRCYCGEDNFRRLDRAGQLAEEKGATVPQIALAYCVCGPMNCFPIMAAWTPRQARENAAAADIELSPAELAWLDLKSETR